MAENKFKKPDGDKGQGEKTSEDKGKKPSKAAEKAAKRYGKKEVRKGD